MNNLAVSIIVPCFNEQEVITTTLEKISNILMLTDFSFELVVVNDGSRDSTRDEILKFKELNPKLKVVIVNLRRNYGHMTAIQAGYEHSSGDLLITIDADLQDPPEIIPDMIGKHLEMGADVVQAVRISRTKDTIFKRLTAYLYYKLVKKMTNLNVIMQAADYRLITKDAVQEVLNLPESQKVMRLLVPYMGFNVATVEFQRQSRIAGKSKYTLSKMINLAIDSFLSFSNQPLRLLSKYSLYMGIWSALLALISIFLHFILHTIPGWTSIVFLLLSGNALLIMSISLIGEYIGKIYVEILQRPRYLVEKSSRFE